MFSKRQLEALRQRLHRRRAELQAIEQTANEAGATVELDQTRMGRLSRMDALQGQAMSREARRRRELELQRIASALQRLAAGEYGYCLRCEEPIAAKRLDYDPATTLCLRCAAEREA